jgi:hypothetical protein
MSNYVVGLIGPDTCRTYCYTSLASARKQLEQWKKCFLSNNLIKHRTTIVERDSHDDIESIKIVFTLENNSEYIMFLSKSSLTREV